MEDNKETQLDQQRFDFERHKFDKEVQLRERELQQKRSSEVKVPLWTAIIALWTAVLVGGITLVGNLRITQLSNRANQELARDKQNADDALAKEKQKADESLAKDRFRSDLILEAIKTGNAQSSRINLRFLLEAGLLSDPDRKIQAALDKKDRPAPTLPSIGAPIIASFIEFEFQVLDPAGHPVPGAMVSCDRGPEDGAGPDGRHTCMVAPGHHSVFITARGPGGSYEGLKSLTDHTVRLKGHSKQQEPL